MRENKTKPLQEGGTYNNTADHLYANAAPK